MSETIYGICENKCLKEVYSKGETDNKFISKTIDATETYTDLNRCLIEGRYYFANGLSLSNLPNDSSAKIRGGILEVYRDKNVNFIKQVWSTSNSNNTYIRYRINSAMNMWGDWEKIATGNFEILTYAGGTSSTATLNYPDGFNKDNTHILACKVLDEESGDNRWITGKYGAVEGIGDRFYSPSATVHLTDNGIRLIFDTDLHFQGMQHKIVIARFD